MFRKVSIEALVLLLLTIYLTQIDVSFAQYYQYPQSHDSPDSYLRPHNVARAMVRVKPLRWDFGLATVAQEYANQLASGPCSLEHSSGPYGENLAMGSGDMSPAQAVAMWINEKSYYDYYSNSCHDSACGHYTQVVWRGSARLGCGKGVCGNGASIIVCNYDPAGNYIGTKPY
ncbi:hypothetical protein F2Q70_00033998 [Brassica cretica]|uniref:Pathogenesis-related protein 1 n=5 Tax=Brassica TaxID=3705 RepID=A0A816QZ22_BRANA|nr:PREDICTED: pathogenesis-related protein 1 [Brassica oleracea var. oleracea]XP_022571570.1 pathogenesis-related protein 1-like [Brassica napus]KAF2543241.1 hypothetical protein F2Q68_00028925 [Brassica cretica]KAG2250024.1 hypothetical protein Bca52824_089652 [Brassica carinata]VDD48091.1 unnamed protein product [Brassica oleracea]KAF2586151.1 hypothetical protein F2Q70_00033998 [Brassica cretica]KAF3599290.1 hypothetical protein F2Q69_00032917 [Brassica cretica]